MNPGGNNRTPRIPGIAHRIPVMRAILSPAVFGRPVIRQENLFACLNRMESTG
jgi:hypothetical protein